MIVSETVRGQYGDASFEFTVTAEYGVEPMTAQEAIEKIREIVDESDLEDDDEKLRQIRDVLDEFE